MVRTRFAPSPTGYLHIGGVRTALFCWLFARRHGGQFILRIDDTDRDRNVEEALRPILEGLRWLGIDWDEGPEVGGPHAPYYQSRRVDRHRTAVERLIEVDAAYRDYATPEEIQAEREAARREGRPFVYSRRWMATTPAEAARFEAQGRRPVVRLKMPREGTLVVEDLVRGTVEFQWAQEQDHVIQRSDGSCLYHLASAVDDHDFQITHVIRAEEHLSNTPRQVFIARALGYPLPRYAHLPLVAEPGSRTKLSKRKLAKYLRNRDFAQLMEHGRRILERLGREVDLETFNPVIVDFYRQVGYLPEALLNYLALLGWSLDDRTEHFTREELVQRFSLEKVNRAPASFDPQKLRAFQVRHMLAVPVQRRVELVLPFLQQAGLVGSPPSAEERLRLTGVVEAAGDRIKVAGDILEFVEFFVPADRLPYDEKAVTKRLRQPPEAKGLVSRFREELATAERFEAEELERCLHGFVEREGIKVGQIIHALRVAITGKTVGLGMFETMAILGRQQCLDRIDRALGLV
ncbi:MAG TPA: glutamate--tRNA ligase [Planctomycetes bacterium]|nr:glutamate--tRNA ligase [Planctomycetota bacterium]